jgi:hypothetical protein
LNERCFLSYSRAVVNDLLRFRGFLNFPAFPGRRQQALNAAPIDEAHPDSPDRRFNAPSKRCVQFEHAGLNVNRPARFFGEDRRHCGFAPLQE